MSDILSLWRRFTTPHPVVVDLAGGDNLAARLAQIAPDARLHILPPTTDLDAWMRARNVRRLALLRTPGDEPLQRAAPLLFRNRCDFVLFPAHPEITARLRYHAFGIFHGAGDSPIPIPPGQEPPAGAELLAVHQRFTLPVLPEGWFIDLAALLKQCSVAPRGVIHIGAHEGQELELYRRAGFQRILLIEANPAVFQRLAARLHNQPDTLAVLCAVSDRNGIEILHVTSNDQSSSILALKRHAELYPDIVETQRIVTTARRLDQILGELGHNPADYNVLNLDIQGAELKALRGAPEILSHIEAICTEVNYEELYEGCPLVEDLDDFLEPLGFARIVTTTPEDPQWGDAFYLRRPAVSMRMLGRWGRFGNQFFQYAFLKLFGRRHQLEVQTSPWIGQQLFGSDDPIVRRNFPHHLETTYTLAESQLARPPLRPVNIDICGYFQYPTAWYAPHKDYIRSLFQPVPALQELLDQAMVRFYQKGNTLVALHLRRGDYGFGAFFLPPDAWYLDWLATLWPTLDKPFLYVASDEPAKAVANFAAYQPLNAADLQLPDFGADYYGDFYIMSQAHALAIANSSFSFAAAMLNARAAAFMRPDLFAGRLVPFDPWNAEPILHRELGTVDHRHLRQVVADHARQPHEPRTLDLLRDRRAQVALSWSQIRADQVPLVLAHDLWESYRLLRQSGVRDLPLIDAERPAMQRVTSRLRDAGGADAIGPWIGATLYASARDLPPVDLPDLPEAVRALLLD